MTHSEAPISITAQTPAKTLVTIRASNAEELDQVVALTIASLASAVQELEAVLRPVNTAVPQAPEVGTIANAFGGSVISQAPSGIPGTGTRTCPHGTMTRILGKTGKYGPYKGHFCPAPQGAPNKCMTQYIKPGQPGYDTFQADQTKE